MVKLMKNGRYLAFGALVLCSVGAAAQPTIRPAGMHAAANYDENAALKAEVDQLKAQLATLNKRMDGLEQASKTAAGKNFELQGKLSKLQTDYDKHSHYFNMVSQAGDTQMVSTPNTSPPTENCQANGNASGSTWLAKYSCGI